MGGGTRTWDTMKYKARQGYMRALRNQASAYHYCPCCTKSFKVEAEYKAHYKTAHVRPK